MSHTQAEQEAWELRAFGCLKKDFIESIESSITFECSGPGMIVMSLLSDAQEMIERGSTELARQEINKAKMVVNHYKLGFVPR